MAEIIASVMPRGPAEAVMLARRAAMDGATWVELRLDHWPAGMLLDEAIEAIALPVLATCRTPRDTGGFTGSAADRRALLEHAIEAGADAIDLEDWETWEPRAVRPRLLIRSHHDFTGPGEDLRALRDELLERGCELTKVVVTAPDLADAAGVLDLLAGTDQTREPTVAFAMGRTAWPTRVLSCLLGAPFVYGCLEPGAETAPGQITVAELAGIYDVRARGTATEIYGLLGNPALQSLGPWLHNRALRRLGRDALYLPLETSRPREVLAALPRRRLRGLSVTAPFKEELVRVCHEIDPVAERVGAINTLTFAAHGRTVGHNTDVAGVAEPLLAAGLPADGGGRPAAILGTGGAARAAAVALRDHGYDVTFLGRTLEPARAFAAERGMKLARLDASVLTELRPVVVVQATPVGGAGRDDEPLVPGWRPERGTFGLDMVYRPARTELLERVAAAGGHAVSGVEMFLTQAAAQLRLFTGESVPADELRAFLAAP